LTLSLSMGLPSRVGHTWSVRKWRRAVFCW
jgi:hypothetical protein